MVEKQTLFSYNWYHKTNIKNKNILYMYGISN